MSIFSMSDIRTVAIIVDSYLEDLKARKDPKDNNVTKNIMRISEKLHKILKEGKL